MKRLLAAAALMAAVTIPAIPAAHAATPATCAGAPCPWPLTPSNYAAETALGNQTVKDERTASPQAKVVGDVQAGTAGPYTMDCTGPWSVFDGDTGLFVDDFELNQSGYPTVPAFDPQIPGPVPLDNWVICFNPGNGLWYSRWVTGLVGYANPGNNWVAPAYLTNPNRGFVLGYNFNTGCWAWQNWCPIVTGSQGAPGVNEGELFQCSGGGTSYVTIRQATTGYYFLPLVNPDYPVLSGQYYMGAGVAPYKGNFAIGNECD